MEIQKLGSPEIETKDGKTTLKWNIGVDTDKDSVNAASFGIYAEVNHGESLNEAIGAILKNVNVPQAIKDLLPK